jgi:hypothetical protein
MYGEGPLHRVSFIERLVIMFAGCYMGRTAKKGRRTAWDRDGGADGAGAGFAVYNHHHCRSQYQHHRTVTVSSTTTTPQAPPQPLLDPCYHYSHHQ